MVGEWMTKEDPYIGLDNTLQIPRHTWTESQEKVILHCSLLANWLSGLRAIHHWISTPAFIIYLSILFGNGTLLFLIQNDHSLLAHVLLAGMLAGTDFRMTLRTMPTVQGVLLWDKKKIVQHASFTQSYFIHTLNLVIYIHTNRICGETEGRVLCHLCFVT